MFKQVTLTSLGLVLALPVAALAEMKMDADGDGSVSMSEFNEAMPDAGAEVFAEIDADANGMLSEEELKMAREGGVLPASEG
ncbi:MAG: EF-hand domain-containing protein [Roseovarius sp.]